MPLLTRDGELSLARRRDESLSVARLLAIPCAEIAELLDDKLCSEHSSAAELRELHQRCRSSIQATDWATSRALVESLSEPPALPNDLWPTLVARFEGTLAAALDCPSDADASVIAELEQRVGHPRARWSEINEAIASGRRQAKRALTQLVEANLRLVVAVARRYGHHGQPLLDLIQEGNLGLMRAAEKFDPSRGFRFSTYAIWWIRQSVTRSLADHSRTIRLPVHVVESLHKLNRARREYVATHGREPDAEQLAEALGIPASRVRQLQTLGTETASLDATIGEDVELRDMVEDVDAADPVEQIAEYEEANLLEQLMAQLSEREQRVLRLRFGFEAEGEQTLEVVGREFALTRERVRQIEAKALQKLRKPSIEAKLGRRSGSR